MLKPKKIKKEKKRHSKKYSSSDEDIKSKKRKKKHHRKRSSEDSESPERKRKKKKKRKKHHKNRDTSSSSDSDDEKKRGRNDLSHTAAIPTRDGEQKNIFVPSLLRSARPEDSLYLDTLPDKNNSIFCNTHYSQAANYKKLCSFPLGMDPRLAKKGKKKKSSRYFSKSSMRFRDSISVVKLLNEDVHLDYIPLHLTYSEEQRVKKGLINTSSQSCANNLGLLDSATQDYIHGREKRVTEEEAASLSEDNKNLETKYWQDQIKSFNERLTKEPHNVSLWLDFIDMQDKAMPHIFADSEDKKSVGKRKNVKLLTERKIAVLESAIGKNIRVLELHIKRLHLGEDLWDAKKLTLEWNKLVSNFPNNMQMWHAYIMFHETHFATFQLDRVAHAYSKCHERLCQMRAGTFLSHKPPENIGYHLVDLTKQLAFVWYQGGRMERSIALFQALIEFNVFCPPRLKEEGRPAALEDRVAIFEAFWDSKAPRFGEPDSIGWSSFMEKREPVSFPEEILEGTQDEEDDILSEGGSKEELWLRLESWRELSHWLPWQRDPEDCEDLERMVSFSEVKRHLFLVSSERETFYLLLQFLSFLGVTVPNRILKTCFPFWESSSVFDALRLETLVHFLGGGVGVQKTDEEEKGGEGREGKEKGGEGKEGKGMFDFPVIGPSVYKEKGEDYFDFVTEVVHRSLGFVAAFAKPKLVIILIHLITQRCVYMRQRGQLSASGIKSYKKNIKNLLKQNEFRSDLGIYYEYARFEASLSGYYEAFKIHAMALALGLQDSQDIMAETPINEELWRHLTALVHIELGKGEKTTVTSVNVIFNVTSSVILEAKLDVSSNPSNGSHLLRVKKKLNSFVESKLNKLSQSFEAETEFLLHHCVSLLSLLQLLSVGFKPACLVYEEFLERIKKIETSTLSEKEEESSQVKKSDKERTFLQSVQEKVYEDYLRLIGLAPKLCRDVADCLPMAPSAVRRLLRDAVQVAPNNVFFLEKMADYQNWRDFLCGFEFHQRNDADILVLVFRLLPHIKKVIALMTSAEFGLMSSGHQLESVLQSAVSTPTGKSCPLLWRLYLRLVRVTKPKCLKEVAYRAINNCPNAKCLYMDCVALVPETMSDILRLMSEKGIRIRIPLEELEVLLDEEKEDVEDSGEEKEEDLHGEEKEKEEVEEDLHSEEKGEFEGIHGEEKEESDEIHGEEKPKVEDSYDKEVEDFCDEEKEEHLQGEEKVEFEMEQFQSEVKVEGEELLNTDQRPEEGLR